MKSQDALKRQIRKLLMLAADDRGDKATAKAAAALAKRLLRANGWSEDDLRGEGESMPGDAHIR